MKQEHDALISDIQQDKSHYNGLCRAIEQKLKEQNIEDADEHFIHYWAMRLSLFETDDITIDFGTSAIDPEKITITITPDYST